MSSAFALPPAIEEQIAAAHDIEARGDLDATIQAWRDLVATVEATSGEFSPALEEPLLGLARGYALRGEIAIAKDTLRRVQNLIHRDGGVHDLRQLTVIDMITELHLADDKPLDADREQQLALYLQESTFGGESEEIVPALLKLAHWYTRSGQFFRTRAAIERAVEIINASGDERDPRLIEPLLLSAKVRRLQRSFGSYKFVEQARDIIVNNPTSTSADLKAEVYLALADAYLAANRDEEAAAAYALVWDLTEPQAAVQKFSTPGYIALAAELNEQENAQIRILQPDRSLGGYGRLRVVSPEERLHMEDASPQHFLVPLDDSPLTYHLADAFKQDTENRSIRMIGHPFQFARDQLYQILPQRLQNEADLSTVTVELDFTVTAEGNVRDIEVISTDVPHALSRLLRDVLREATFRPRLDAGIPVRTDHYRLTQAFDR